MLLCRHVAEVPGMLMEVYFELCAGCFGGEASRLMVVLDDFVALTSEVL